MEFNAALPNPILTLTAQAPGTVPSAGLLNDHCRGATLTFSTSALTGAPTLSFQLFAVDLVSQSQVSLGAATTPVAAVAGQAVAVQLYPGGASPVVNAVLPLAFVIKVIVAGTGTVTGTLAGNLQS